MSEQKKQPEATITISLGEATLTVSECWPDDDAPDQPTAADVVALIERDGGLRKVLSDWCLLDGMDAEVSVSVRNPEYRGPDVLIPEFAPAQWTTTTEQIR